MPRRSNIDVRFVAAPFLPEHQPALGVSSMVSVLREEGFNADIKYLNIDFANKIGRDLHQFITVANPPNLLLGEMIFGASLWRDDKCSWVSYRHQLENTWSDTAYAARKPAQFRQLLDEIELLRNKTDAILQEWVDCILVDRPRILGFTTTFQQNIASLALARALRENKYADDSIIVFGGANCEGEMGEALSRHFSFVDHVVSGEGEEAILALAKNYCSPVETPPLDAKVLRGYPGKNLNDLPTPEFQDYFDAIKGTALSQTANLVAESSRGCWWGMKSHCTFCGLNGETMAFRSKNAERFYAELVALSAKYGPTYFALSDNILDMKYLTTLFPRLAERDEPLTLFYEVKANLRKDQLELMASGGIVRIQPGIESLSTNILQLMAKGTSQLQNIQLLKWCEEFQIEAAWNLLYGFPGEDPEEYVRIANLIPAIRHLQPPQGTGRVRMDRFSPYWRNPRAYAIDNVRAFWAYRFAYPGISEPDLTNLAYYFDFDSPRLTDVESYTASTVNEIDLWREMMPRAVLEFIQQDGEWKIRDTRGLNDGFEFDLSIADREILLLMDRTTTAKACYEKLAQGWRRGINLTHGEFTSSLNRLERMRWIASERETMVSLVVNRQEKNRIVDRMVALRLSALGLAESLPLNSPDKN